jgi:hypothetical protein
VKQMPFGVLSVQCGDWYAIYNNVVITAIVLVPMMPQLCCTAFLLSLLVMDDDFYCNGIDN